MTPALSRLDRIGLYRDRLEERRDKRLPQPKGVTAHPFEAVLEEAAKVLDLDPAAALTDDALVEHERGIRKELADAGDSNPYPTYFNASSTLARLCWMVVRLRKPSLVVETGVAAGFTSSYLLAALEANGAGELHSIDPVIGTPEQVERLGWLVPERLRSRWTLHRARSRRALVPIAERHGPIGVFLHDGLHTKPTMSWELRTAARFLAEGGAVLADDVERNPVFAEWAEEADLAYWTLVQTESPGHHCGLALR